MTEKYQNAEKAFVDQLVKNMTTLVVNENVTPMKKIREIIKALAENRGVLRQLKVALTRENTEEATERIKRWIVLRTKASVYLKDTARWIVKKKAYPSTMDQMPRTFAYPEWDKPVVKEDGQKKSDEFPFMDFSS